MLHQTLIPFQIHPSSPPSSSSSPSSTFPPLSYYSHSFSQVEKEEKMECLAVALKKSCRAEAVSLGQGLHAEEMVWAVERGNLLLGDDFLVDELLDLGELTEPEKEDEEDDEKAAPEKEEADNSNNSNSTSNSSSPLSSFDPTPLALPAPDEAELEWVSRIVDDSLSEFPPCSAAPPYRHHNHEPAADETLTQKYAPSLTTPTACVLSTESLVPLSVKAKRTKRPRTAAAGVWSISSPPPFTDSSSTVTTSASSSPSSSSCSSPSYSSYLIYDHSAAGITAPVLLKSSPKKHKPKKRGRKPKSLSTASAPAAGGGERRCSHCGVQKTPQWRTGPQGAKTLCNACGVRFKSGRLLPEYRPACSPTFVSHVHSNSHRKVLEMRRKKEEQLLSAAAPPVPSF